jgi:hypothetical protein
MNKANERQVGGKHYKGGIEHWDYILANDIPYIEAQIIKYVERHTKKNGIQDLEKAQHFLEKLIEVEAEKEVSSTVLDKLIEEMHTLDKDLARVAAGCKDSHCARIK